MGFSDGSSKSAHFDSFNLGERLDILKTHLQYTHSRNLFQERFLRMKSLINRHPSKRIIFLLEDVPFQEAIVTCRTGLFLLLIDEFKKNTVSLHLTSDKSYPVLSEELGITASTLTGWVNSVGQDHV